MMPIVTVFCLLLTFTNGDPISYQSQRLIYSAPASEAASYQAPTVPAYQPIGLSNYYATPTYQNKSTYKRSIHDMTFT